MVSDRLRESRFEKPSGIIFLNRNGLRWRNAAAAYGPHKTLYNRWKRRLSGMQFMPCRATGQRLHWRTGIAEQPAECRLRLGDRGYDADWFREALKDKGRRACIPGRRQRKKSVKYDKRRYIRRNRIKIMFGKLKDWRPVATRQDRCPKVLLSAITLAATVIYWL